MRLSAGSILLLGGCDPFGLVDWETYDQRKADLTDDDGDGFSDIDGDCDDTDASVFPGADEVCNGVDDNCDGAVDIDPVDGGGWYPDEDADGYGDSTQESEGCFPPSGWVSTSGDCDDTNAAVSPDADEVCNSADDDCDGAVDEDAVDASEWFIDQDGDGYGAEGSEQRLCLPPESASLIGGDCDDGNDNVSPAEPEVCLDNIDNNCSGTNDGCEWNPTESLDDHIKISGAYDGEFGRASDFTDMDGDGSPDLILGAYSAYDPRDNYPNGHISIFKEVAATGESETRADYNLWGELDGAGIGHSSGDINKDGYQDLIIGASLWGRYDFLDGTGRAFIVYGPIIQDMDLVLTFDWLLNGKDPDERMAERVFGVGDISGDGVDDFVLSSPYGNHKGVDSSGYAHIITDAGTGTADAADVAQATFWTNSTDDYVGGSAVGADPDGDGERELLIGGRAAGNGYGAVYLLESETLSGLITHDDADITWGGEGSTGSRLSTGEADGDGLEDILVGADGAGAAYLIFGENDLSGSYIGDVSVKFRFSDSTIDLGDLLLADFNGDLVEDVVLAEDVGNDGYARVHVFYGPFDSFGVFYEDDADVTILSSDVEDEIFTALLDGDVNADGSPDLILGSEVNDGYNGAAYIVTGVPY